MIFAGLDVGGTSARALVRRGGSVIGAGRAAGGNLRQVGPRAVLASIEAAILAAVPDLDLRECHVHAGVAGLATPEDEAALFSVPHPFASFTAESDAQLARDASFGGGPGVLLIVGTGSIVLGRAGDGREGRRLGFGFPLETTGGAALGLSSLRAALAHLQHGTHGEPNHVTPLANLVRERLGPPRDIVDAARNRGPDWYASHADLLFRAADLGDPEARDLLQRWRRECREAVESLRQELGVTSWSAWGGLSRHLGDVGELGGFQEAVTTPEVWAAEVAARR